MPVQTSGTWNNVDVPQPVASRHRPVSETAVRDDPDIPTKSSQSHKGELERPDARVRPRQKLRVGRDVQSAFEPGPQGTSTPSPTFDRREAFPAAKPAVPLLAVPPRPPSPPPTSKSSAVPQSRPIFEPVVAAVSSTADQLPVAHAPAFHFRKPDVISDVNEDVAEPLRPAPRTDRHRQRTSRSSQGTSQEQVPVEPPRPTVAAQEDSLSETSSSGSDTDDGDSTESGDSGEFLLPGKQTQAKPSQRQAVGELRGNFPPAPAAAEGRARVRLLYILVH